jgi:hypothetical protein
MTIAGQVETAAPVASFQAGTTEKETVRTPVRAPGTRLSASPKEKTMKTRISFMRFPASLKDRRNCVAWGMLSPAIWILTLGVSALAQQPTIMTIDAPGAGTSIGYGTEGIAINSAGQIAGLYAGYSNAMRAYVRGLDGRVVMFDGPGAGSPSTGVPFPAVSASLGTYAVGMDDSGAVTGYVINAYGVAHSFLLAADGTSFTMFDVPGAGKGNGQGTFAGSLSPSGGVISGWYLDATGMSHGFLRAGNGAITEFDVPAAATGPGLGTATSWAQCVNSAGAMTGYYFDQNGAAHGYVRAPNGTITTFDAPGAGTGSGQGTYTWAINPAGVAAGTSQDNNGVYHGLLRAADGTITMFDVSGAGTGSGQGTQVEGIDPTGVATGYYTDANNLSHGYLRTVDGKFTFFDAPGAGKGSGQGTFPMTNNPGGMVTGFYVDGGGVYHAFVRH